VTKKNIRFLKNLSTGLVVAAMILAFLIAGIRIFGVQVYGVLTGSMEPEYPIGSLIYVGRVDDGDLRVNDVITFSVSPNVIVTHRIVELVPDETNPMVIRYRTKGDANDEVDAALVGANDVIGRVMFAVPQMGYIANYIQHPPGIYVAILVCGLMIAFVFYTDSLENKQKTSFQRSSRRGYAPQARSRTQRPAQQREYARQRPYPQQGEYQRQRPYPQQGEYQRQRPYPQQGEYARQRPYPQQGEYPRQRPYPQQGEYQRQRPYPQQGEYPRQRPYPQQGQAPRQREYSQPRDNRSGRM